MDYLHLIPCSGCFRHPHLALNSFSLSYSLGRHLVLLPLLLLIPRLVLIRQALPLLSLSLGPLPCFPRGLFLCLAFQIGRAHV